MHRIYLIGPGPRPFWGDMAEHLWGPGCNYDSDGNDDRAPPDGWTELTLSLRAVCDEQRVDVDPLDDREPLVLVIRSEKKDLVRKVAGFLRSEAGGELSDDPPQDRGSAR
jgi:hypothetical protein